jgi:hypothetical protein
MATYDPALFIGGKYRPDLAGGQNIAPYPGNLEAFDYDPNAVGGGVAKYYGNVMQGMPTYEPIMRNISGRLQPDTTRQIAQAAAERGVGIGSYGGANDATAMLRALGLTSQDLTNQGIQQYNQTMTAVPALSPTNLFITPTDRSKMNLQWATSQAEINAALQRQREMDKAALERARVTQETAYGTTGMNVASQQRMQSERLAQQAATDAAIMEAARKAQEWEQSRALANEMGLNAWSGGGANWSGGGPGGGITTPSTQGGVYSGSPSTGAMYSGGQFASPEAEYAMMQEIGPGGSYYDPYAGFFSQDYYAPGELATAYDYGAPPTYEDYYYGF